MFLSNSIKCAIVLVCFDIHSLIWLVQNELREFRTCWRSSPVVWNLHDVSYIQEPDVSNIQELNIYYATLRGNGLEIEGRINKILRIY